MKKLIMLLLTLSLFLIAFATFTSATVYYQNYFTNSSSCSGLSFSHADNSSGTYSSSCSVSNGIATMTLRNVYVTGLDYQTILADEDMANRDTTYTMIFKKSANFNDFVFFPYKSDYNLIQKDTGTCGYSNFFSTPPFYSSYYPNEFGIIPYYIDHTYIFGGGLKINYPDNEITFYGGYSDSTYCNTPHVIKSDYNNSAMKCINDYCVAQFFYNGTGDKNLSVYLDNNLIAVLGDYGVLNDYSNSLQNVTSSFFYVGNSQVTVYFDMLKLEDGNKLGAYTTGSGSPNECSDGIDNDFDGLIDYPDDPSCTSYLDNDESPKDASLCSEAVCSQADRCIYYTDFDCNDELGFHSWNATPIGLASLEKSDGMKILLNKYLDHPSISSFILPNGSLFIPDYYLTLSTNYSGNKKTYSQVEHNLLFYFINDFYQYNMTSNGTRNESVTIAFYGENNNLDFLINLQPVSSPYPPYDVVIYISASNGTDWSVPIATTTTTQNAFYKFELDVMTYKPSGVYTKGRYDFTYRSPTDPNILWSNWKYSGNRWDFLNSADTYVNSISLAVAGDSAYTDNSLYPNPIAETSMYLSSINVRGVYDEEETATLCTEWLPPYFFKEEFNGCLENCGWVTSPSNLCTYGALESSITDTISLSKGTTYLSADLSRYATFSFDITPKTYDPTSAVMIELYDSTSTEVVSLLLSNGILYNRVDGNYEVLYSLQEDWNTHVQINIDLTEDTFDFYISDIKMSSGNKLSNSNKNYNDISGILIFSVDYAYILDNLKIYSSDQNNIAVIVSPETIPTYVSNTTRWCGNVFRTTPVCSADSDCDSGQCMANGKCSSFNMKYCDLHGMERGNMCLISAYTTCALTGAKNVVFNNFIYVLIVILFLVGLTYLSVMLRSRNN